MGRLRLYYDMTGSLRQNLPPLLAESCWCSNLRETVLTISVHDSQQAALLHCHQREILKRLNALYADRLGQELKKLHIHVAARNAAAEE